MEFTGERYIPAEHLCSEIDIEHWQRYLSIHDLVRGKVVVDAASGTGYGSHILARSAARVYGVEISAEAAHFAATTYRGENLHFFRASISALPLVSASVDVVVSFETIEHVDESTQQAFLSECKRLLKPGGILIISTPDKEIYSDLTNYTNEFHVKEFYRDEFCRFLTDFFKEVVVFRQFAALGYFFCGETPSCFAALNFERISNRAKYLIAICSDVSHPAELQAATVFIDQQQAHQQKVARVLALQCEIVEKNEVITNLEQWVQKCRDTIAERDMALQRQGEEWNRLEDRYQALQRELVRTGGELTQRQQELNAIHHSTAWRLASLFRRGLAFLGKNR